MEKVVIYPVKVQGKQRKAVDIESLNNWLDNKILSANPFLVELEESVLSVSEFKAAMLTNMFNELNGLLKKELGLANEPEEAQVVSPEGQPPQVEEPPEPVTKPTDETPSDEDIVTLDD